MLTDVTMEHYDRTMDIDLRGVLLGMKHGIRTMLERGNGGAIVNWSSIGGLNASPFTTRVLGGQGRRDLGDEDRRRRVRPQGHPRERHLPRLHPDRDHGRAPRVDARHPARRRALQPRRPAARGRGGRRVPRVGPRVVRHRRDHPGRRRLVREDRVTDAAPTGSRPVRRHARRTGSRTRGCSPGTAPTSTTSCCRGCCTRRFVRSPFARATIRGIDTVGGALPLPGVRVVFTAADLNPDVKEQWHTSIGPASPETPRPAARRRRGALRRRPGRAGRRRDAVPRRGRGRARRRRLRAAAGGRRLHRRARTPTRSCTQGHGSNVIGELAGLPASALDDVFDAAAHVASETIYQQAYAAAPLEGRGLVVDYSRSTGELTIYSATQVAARGAAVLLPPARHARSTASAW